MIDDAYWAMLAAAHLPGEQYTEPVGDPGYFGPDSAIWYVHGDVSGVLGGVSGLLLGTLNEPVTHGTNQHSNYLQDPIKRLGFTASFVMGVTYGSTPVADKLTGTIRAMHKRVHGTMPDGRPYSATESADIIWTGVTQAYSAARAHVRYHPRPLRGRDLDRYFADYAVISEKLGATGVPKSRADVEDYFAMMRPRLTVSEETLEAIRFLRGAYGDDAGTRLGSLVLSRAATDLLPDFAKKLLGFTPRTPVGPIAARSAGTAIVRTLRYGVRWRNIEEAHARVGAPYVPPTAL
ncbi:oxygenase MpaB family protein [Actinomadura atramentaria]|uniref:oxygenase MpaB family protein n=1 Tax=Actinomadura atramentaria TaxID=1990 RepID=UPI000399F1FE|nr:oxygenase MpaB family protein [Actinomadura atramentaria]